MKDNVYVKTAEILSSGKRHRSINRNQSYLPEEDVMSSVAKGKYSDFHQNPLRTKITFEHDPF